MDEENKAMTVNERLYVNGLIEEFYRAVEERDIREVSTILEKIGLTEISINPILEQLGLRTSSD